MPVAVNRAFLVASKHNLVEQCEGLLAAGADVNARDPEFEGGKTAILIAAGEGHTNLVRFLLRHDADLNDKCLVGRTVSLLQLCISTS